MIRKYQSEIISKHSLAIATICRMFSEDFEDEAALFFKGEHKLMQRLFLDIALDQAQKENDNFRTKAIESMINVLNTEEERCQQEKIH